MNPTIKTEWIKRLRSGDYKQGRGVLYSKGCYCCLGVLCDIAEDAGVVVSSDEFQSRRRYSSSSNLGDYNTGVLPEAVQEWAGLTCASPEVGDATLTSLNDDGVPFEELAVLIEKNF